MRSGAIILASIMLLSACGASEEEITRLGDNLSNSIYEENNSTKMEFIFNGCQFDVVTYDRQHGNHNWPFESQGTNVGTVDISKFDAAGIKIRTRRRGDVLLVPCSDDSGEGCIVRQLRRRGDYSLEVITATDGTYLLPVRSGRSDRALRLMSDLIEACN